MFQVECHRLGRITEAVIMFCNAIQALWRCKYALMYNVTFIDTELDAHVKLNSSTLYNFYFNCNDLFIILQDFSIWIKVFTWVFLMHLHFFWYCFHMTFLSTFRRYHLTFLSHPQHVSADSCYIIHNLYELSSDYFLSNALVYSCDVFKYEYF